MKLINRILKLTIMSSLIVVSACQEVLDETAENRTVTGQTDYTITANMIQSLIGMYGEFQARAWHDFAIISVRGDDVNAAGDQSGYVDTDNFNYDVNFWMFRDTWKDIYRHIFISQSAIEQIEQYNQNASDKTTGNQYIAEVKVVKAWELFQLSRMWGKIYIPVTSDPYEFKTATLYSKDEVMNYISSQMDEAIPNLPDMRPNERTDVRGGVTKYTALAIKALANLELKNYQKVADATSQIISSGKFSLEPNFYELFKTQGKLNNENLFEMQYSDYGQRSGDSNTYSSSEFFYPQSWTSKVAGVNTAGWGFYEPTLKYIKFMLDRGETIRLETSVLFTNRGIDRIKEDPKYANLPAWISNTTRSGDVINDFSRAMFSSGKHYMPSDQLILGRTAMGSNKNFTCIRYAEILLMHAEALTQGATSTGMTALQAVNAVRSRASMPALTSVDNAQVMNEKFAELAMEWGTRFYDMVRLGKYSDLSYEGRTFTENKIFFPYPQDQVDILPPLQVLVSNSN